VATIGDDYGGLGARFYSACIERPLLGRAVAVRRILSTEPEDFP
jgi:hypothetical protein